MGNEGRIAQAKSAHPKIAPAGTARNEPAPREGTGPGNFDGIRAVVFDAGHTLIFPDHQVYLDVAREAGAAAPALNQVRAAELVARAAFERIMGERRKPGPRWDSFYWDLFYGILFRELHVPEGRVAWANAELLRRGREGLGFWTQPAPGARETLAALAEAGYLLGVISNSDGRAERLLEAAGLREHLTFVVDSHEIGISKPDPRIFRLGLAKAGVRPEESVYVGDYVAVDVVGARGAGMVPVLYDPAGISDDPGCTVVRRLEELTELLPRRGRRREES